MINLYQQYKESWLAEVNVAYPWALNEFELFNDSTKQRIYKRGGDYLTLIWNKKGNASVKFSSQGSSTHMFYQANLCPDRFANFMKDVVIPYMERYYAQCGLGG